MYKKTIREYTAIENNLIYNTDVIDNRVFIVARLLDKRLCIYLPTVFFYS